MNKCKICTAKRIGWRQTNYQGGVCNPCYNGHTFEELVELGYAEADAK